MHKKLSPMMIALALALPAVAGAANVKVYPGSMCNRDGATPQSGDSFVDEGSHMNAALSKLIVYCPIVRDNPAQALLSARVDVVDLHTGEQVSCKLTARTPTGSLHASNVQNSGIAGTGNVALDFPAVPQVTNGFYYLRCEIPGKTSSGAGKSGIISYRIDEPGAE